MKTLIADYQPLWFSIAHKYTNNYHQSEELVQEALTRYLQSGNREVENIKAYVAKTIYHLYISQIRKEKTADSYLKQASLSSNGVIETASGLENHSEANQMLLRMYHLLTPAERAVFVLKKAFEVEYEQLEELLGLSNDNCRQLLRRAKSKMQAATTVKLPPCHQASAFIAAFFKASQQGQLGQLVAYLQTEVYQKKSSRKHAARSLSLSSSVVLAAKQRA